MPGVMVGDIGEKLGLNGVDNGCVCAVASMATVSSAGSSPEAPRRDSGPCQFQHVSSPGPQCCPHPPRCLQGQGTRWERTPHLSLESCVTPPRVTHTLYHMHTLMGTPCHTHTPCHTPRAPHTLSQYCVTGTHHLMDTVCHIYPVAHHRHPPAAWPPSVSGTAFVACTCSDENV